MAIYTKRNAVVGYLVTKAVKRKIAKKTRRSRGGLKVAAYVGLGLVSAGMLAAVLAIALRRRHADDRDGDAFDDEIVGEYVTAPEPAPAT